MFDIGFIELLLISVVSLLVLGPERLPDAIKTAGLWIGRLRRSFNNVKRDIEKELGADDIRRQLRNEAIMEKFDSTKSQFTKSIDSIKSETDAVKDKLDLKKQVTGLMGESNTKSDNKAPTKPSDTMPEAPKSMTADHTDNNKSND